jgi:hypothetical protein
MWQKKKGRIGRLGRADCHLNGENQKFNEEIASAIGYKNHCKNIFRKEEPTRDC